MPVVKRLQDEAYDNLKEKIAGGILVEGTLYSESQMTKELGMSRTPVRDALLRLSMEGLIEIFPSRGFAVRKVSKTELKETLEIRSVLESYAAYALAEQIETPHARETLVKLNKNIDDQERLLLSANPSITKFVELNSVFHNIMIDFLQNDGISQIYKKYESSIREINYNHFKNYQEKVQETFKGHIQILALIRSGEKEQAFTRAKNHCNVALFSR